MADHPGREPGEVEIALAADELAQVGVDLVRLPFAHEVFGMHARGVGQLGPGAYFDGVHGLGGIEVVELSAGEVLAMGGVGHGLACSAGWRVCLEVKSPTGVGLMSVTCGP